MLPFNRKDEIALLQKKSELLPASTIPFHPIVWKSILIFGVFNYGSYTIMIHLCEVNHKIPFSSASVVLLIELCKLLVSLVLSFNEFRKASLIRHLSVKKCIPFSIPALLYCINNNISVQMQPHMDPATFQVLCNLKIISTAFLYKVIIKRPITSNQWLALVLLTCAGISNSYGGYELKPNNLETGAFQNYITWQGILMMCTYCLISGLAGVYCEYILKKNDELPLSVQNLVLYVYGVICNGLLFVYEDGNSQLFAGYTTLTWLIIVGQTISGLIMSVIMKHSSNILRLFFISCAMLVTTTLSILVFHMTLNAYFILACSLVVFALWLYHRH